ncbi:MAG TPA: hypothetical protein VMX17_06045 [Candidatus Glassbacteria bacterium]|jgi:hypothetical protein|nr:hypothetical protein [Candidatus Bathyarchaeota archaeon]HUU87297.1 hypothetical protein [Candidatus Glassbacteria bacterium]
MKKQFFKDKRAVTPVLSHLLLTIVAVSIMSLATSATFIITTNLRETMGERLLVEDVWFEQDSGEVNIYVRNVGRVTIQVAAIYVNKVGQLFNSPFNLEINENKWLKADFDWLSGESYYIDILTNRGTHVASYYKAP